MARRLCNSGQEQFNVMLGTVSLNSVISGKEQFNVVLGTVLYNSDILLWSSLTSCSGQYRSTLSNLYGAV